MKAIKCLLSFVLSAVLLTGCSFVSGGDDLLQAPKPPESFVLLQKQLEQIMGDNMTYVSPQSGSYRNTVAFEDINGDGKDEAIAFLREGTGGKIYVYAFELQNGEYQTIGRIGGPGSALGAMSLLDIQGDNGKLIVLTWTLSGDVKQGMTVCGVQDGKLTDLLDVTYTSYTISDLDQDGSEELFTVSYDDAGRKTAQVYDYIGENMLLLSQTEATQDVQTVANITTGSLDESGRQAVFVDNKFENDNGMQTDIYVLDKSKLRNVALTSDVSTYRSMALYYSEDINGDGIIKVPQLKALPGYQETQTAQTLWTLWMVDWYQYNINGEARWTQTTYDSLAEGWMFNFPQGWRGKVTATNISEAGVSQTAFMEVSKPNDLLLTIYVFTGDDREQAAAAGGLIHLGSKSDTCYAAKLETSESEYQLTEDEVIQAFSIIQSEWQ